MKIIVDIPKQDYIYITKKHCLPSCDERTLRNSYYEMIANGVSLPEGHGRLIDADELTKRTLCKTFGLRSVDIENATTIIEADRGDEE